MGFISFNENYYIKKLSSLEGKKLYEKSLYETKQILKVLDDLADEGYTELNNILESKYQIITRLRKILLMHEEKPFEILHSPNVNVSYGEKNHEITELCNNLIETAKENRIVSSNPFLEEIRNYCNWINYKPDTAYVFLLRDALLPYTYFRSRERRNLHPWLISRDFLSSVGSKKGIDDEIRLPIYEALESNITEYSEFKEFFKNRIMKVMKQHPFLYQSLKDLLSQIKQNKIMVIESGYCGTIPMLLTSLDNRVDFKLYTTAPFLFNVYKDKIFCKKYENLRLLETLYSQNFFMKYSQFSQGKFYVKLAQGPNIKNETTKEIYSIIK